MESTIQKGSRRRRSTSLSDAHLAYLLNRGLSLEVIEERGYYSIDRSRELPLLEAGEWVKPVIEQLDLDGNEALVIPLHRAGTATPSCYQLRMDVPRQELVDSGQRTPRVKAIKFEIPSGVERGTLSGNIPADIHPSITADQIQNPATVFVITEGIVKADAILTAARAHNLPIVPVALTGVTMGFHRPESVGNLSNRSILTPDLAALPLFDRTVVLAWDADANINSSVASALVQTGDLLAEAGAKVEALVVPRVAGDSKSGIDDWLAHNESKEAFVSLLDSTEDLERLRLVGKRYPDSDFGRGERLADELLRRQEHRIIPAQEAGKGTWLAFDGVRLEVDGAANSVTRIAADLAQRDPAASRTADSTRIRAAVASAATTPALAVKEEALDADLNVLATSAGQLIHIPSGEVRRTTVDDLVTRTTAVPYDASQPTPEFDRFLEQITCGDAELAEYLQAMWGMILLGTVVEEKIFFLYGNGANGKTTLMDIFSGILGTDLVNNIRGDQLSNLESSTLADLRGRRLALATDSMRRDLAVSAVKPLSSKGAVVGRSLYKNAVSFQPSHTIVAYTNVLPRLDHPDPAIWRRIVVVPFRFQVQQKDYDLAARILRNEGAGILAWGIEGARKLLERGGLPACEAVDTAKERFKEKEDYIGSWLDKFCVIGAEERERGEDLARHLSDYCRAQYSFERTPDSTKLRKELEESQGIDLRDSKINSGKTRVWKGIALRQDAWEDLAELAGGR